MQRSKKHNAKILEMEKEIVQYKTEITRLQSENQELNVQAQRSEGFELKEMAMNSILKLTAMSDLDNLSKD